VRACLDVDIEMEDNIDVKALTKEYDNNNECITGYITKAIDHRDKEEQYVITFFEKPRSKETIFFLKDDLIMATVAKFHNAFKLRGLNYTCGDYVGGIKSIGKRKDPHDETSRYRRSGKNNNIVSIFAYVTTYDINLPYSDIIKDQKKIADVVWKGVFGNANRVKNIGKNIVSAATEQGGGLIDWILNNRGGADKTPEIAADNTTKDVVDYFKDGVSFRHRISLDHFMVDYDIKEFLSTKVGVTSWNDLNSQEKQVCFENYPNKDLPDWDKLAKESY
jgi:hypothetical protein